ncbi:MAG TPA: epoxide hydrolase [Thermoanaerobaculia bacterium]|jgi:pimeloyl-ACP methyl ester carboxylesterase|nr:epoxide hydrolase [Thermoanaerobaculia bacterium]
MRFRIDLDLGDLRERLLRTRWPDQANAQLQEVVRYWADGFDWPAQQARLNRFEHHIEDVGGERIHFIHAKGGADAIPLLLVHGWPGSFVEFVDIIPMLQGPFELIVPSLPGYGFSSKATGMSNARIAELFLQLMSQLGHERFAAQGGDWGAGVATWMALKAPRRLTAIHLNYIPGSYAPPIDAPLTAEEGQFLKDKERWGDEHGAYGHVQRTRPLTLAYGLNDSPAGLAAWILEKFREWADPASNLSIDALLTNITIYWATETIHSSMRLYRESAATPLRNVRVPVPTAVAHFPLEAPFPPRSYIERGYDLRRFTEQPAGGHFAALEQPESLAKDIREFWGV